MFSVCLFQCLNLFTERVERKQKKTRGRGPSFLRARGGGGGQGSTLIFSSKIVSEYDQEIPQSQTADNPVASRGRAAQPSRDTRKTN